MDELGDGDPAYVNLEKRADILQSTFEHYFKMAMDHHTKAATTSNILLIIVAAVVGLIGLDNQIGGSIDFVGGLAVFIIGLFGMVWARKQHERYHFWAHIAHQYQEELTNIVPLLKTGEDYYDGAQEATAKEFWPLFSKRIKDRYLWVSLHFFVAVLGIGLAVVSALGA